MNVAAGERKDRIRGAIVGAVVGDAFGGPLEGISPAEMSRRLAARCTTPSPWSYTDDGLMNIAVAESIVATGTVDPEHLLGRFQAHYEPARGFGRGMKIALTAFATGTSWDRCAFAAWPEGSQGNGGAVRITPVACAAWTSAEALDAAIALATRVTHTHRDALSAARVHAHALRIALETRPGELDAPTFLRTLGARVRGEAPWVEAALTKIGMLFARAEEPAEAARALGTSAFAKEAVPAALWAFLASGESYEATVSTASRLGGDVDSICAMAGALAGARHGMDGIPSIWIRNLAHERPSIDDVKALCDRIGDITPSAPRG
ncbi:putative hydrolase [Minicystis rosea]|nr:putative hydrolase [Minicystis rosea]